MKYFFIMIMAVVFSILCQSCTSSNNNTINSNINKSDNFKFSLVFYKKYCGPGHPRNAEFNKDAVNVIDQVCKVHDDCYSNSWYFHKTCDVQIAKSILSKDLVGFEQKVLGALMVTYFSFSPSASDNNFLQLIVAPETVSFDSKNPFERPIIIFPHNDGVHVGIGIPIKLPEILFFFFENLFTNEKEKIFL